MKPRITQTSHKIRVVFKILHQSNENHYSTILNSGFLTSQIHFMKKVGFYFLLFLGIASFGQIQPNQSGSLNELSFYVNTNTRNYEDVTGSKYIFDDFKPAKIKGFKGVHEVRFDAVDNTIEFKSNDGGILFLSKNQPYVIELIGDSPKRIFEIHKFLKPNKKIETTFFEKRFNTEKYILYKRYRIKYEPEKPAKSSYEKKVEAKFTRLEDAYYLNDPLKSTDYLIEIPRKKKPFYAFFAPRQAAIKTFVKKNGINPNIEKDVLKTLEYYFNTN